MSGRRYITTARLESIQTQLSDIDRLVLRDVARFRLMSSRQIGRLFYGPSSADDRRNRRRLARLVELGVLERLPRRVGGRGRGSDSTVLRVGRAGRRLLQAEDAAATTSQAGPSWQPSDLFAAHTLWVVDLYVELVELHRSGLLRLLEFTPEPGAWRTYSRGMQPSTLKPDGFLRLEVGGVEWRYFIELDRGTESARVIDRKLESYLDYLDASPELEVVPLVVFLVDAKASYHSAGTDARVETIAELASGQRPPAEQLFVVRRRDRPPWLDQRMRSDQQQHIT